MPAFTGTLPTFVCNQAYSDCVAGAQGNATAQRGCRDDIRSQCGTTEPESVVRPDSGDQLASSRTSSSSLSSTSTASPSRTVSSSSTGSTASDTAETSSGSASDDNDGGLGIGAKAGVGIGAGLGGTLVISAVAYFIYRSKKVEKGSAPDRFEKPELADTQWYGHELHAVHHQELEAPVGTQEMAIKRSPVEMGMNEREESELRRRMGEERPEQHPHTPGDSNSLPV